MVFMADLKAAESLLFSSSIGLERGLVMFLYWLWESFLDVWRFLLTLHFTLRFTLRFLGESTKLRYALSKCLLNFFQSALS